MSWRDSTIIASVTVCHRGSYAERYSRSRRRVFSLDTSTAGRIMLSTYDCPIAQNTQSEYHAGTTLTD